MNKNLKGYKTQLFASIIIIALGIVIKNTVSGVFGNAGIVFIAVGGLFFIKSMLQKKKEEEQNKE